MAQPTERHVARTRRHPAGSFNIDPSVTRYSYLSQRPLHVLVFLLPLIVVFEIGASTTYVTHTIRARKVLSEFFDWFGAGGLHVPAILTVVVLLVWHVLSADRWRIRSRVLAGMALESVAWTAPLLVLGLILARALGLEGVNRAAAAVTSAAASAHQDWFANLAMALGAGVYEEVLFRLVGMALVHIAVVDVGGFSDLAGKITGVIVTSILFAGYHDVMGPAGMDWARATYFFAAGVYFGVVYLARGLGICVGVHALYDVVVLLRPLG